MATGHPVGNFSHTRETEAREIQDRMQPNGDGFWFHDGISPTEESEHLLHGLAGPYHTVFPAEHRFTHMVRVDKEWREREAKQISNPNHNLHGSPASITQQKTELAKELDRLESGYARNLENCTVLPPRSRADPGKGDVWMRLTEDVGKKGGTGQRGRTEEEKELARARLRARAEGLGKVYKQASELEVRDGKERVDGEVRRDERYQAGGSTAGSETLKGVGGGRRR